MTRESGALSDEWMALNQAVLCNPADDAPRLIMADWLDEHGEHNLAEFIRVQIGLTRAPFMSREYRKLSDRESHVVPPVPEGVPDHWGPVYRRGFLYKVKMSFQEFRANARQLFSKHPITKVEVTDKILTNQGGKWGFCCYEDQLEKLSGNELLARNPYLLPSSICTDFGVADLHGGCRTQQSAKQATEWGLAKYGRDVVGLPSIPEPAIVCFTCGQVPKWQLCFVCRGTGKVPV